MSKRKPLYCRRCGDPFIFDLADQLCESCCIEEDEKVESSIDKDVAGSAADDRATGADIANASNANPVCIGRVAGRRYLNDAVNIAKHVIAQPRHRQTIRVDRWRALLNLAAMVNRVRYSRNLRH